MTPVMQMEISLGNMTLKFRFVFWDVLPCKITPVDNYFTRQYIPEDKSELHTRRSENLKSYKYDLDHVSRELS
jgi:hypothetical protein